MAKFSVTLGEVASYTIEVEAANAEEAEDMAEAAMCEKGVSAFKCEVHDRAVEEVVCVRPVSA